MLGCRKNNWITFSTTEITPSLYRTPVGGSYRVSRVSLRGHRSISIECLLCLWSVYVLLSMFLRHTDFFILCRLYIFALSYSEGVLSQWEGRNNIHSTRSNNSNRSDRLELYRSNVRALYAIFLCAKHMRKVFFFLFVTEMISIKYFRRVARIPHLRFGDKTNGILITLFDVIRKDFSLSFGIRIKACFFLLFYKSCFHL